MKNNKFWDFIERFKSIVEIIAALLVIVPVILTIMQQGLMGVIPAWFVFLTTILAILLGYILGKRVNTTPVVNSISPKRNLIRKIDFDFKDSPTSHGWRIMESSDKTQPTFTHPIDGFYGNVLRIKSSVRYMMELEIDQMVGFGSYIEFVAKFDKDSRFFTLVRVQSKSSTKTRDLWLKFRLGIDQPKRIDDRSENWYEYEIPIKPILLEGEWGHFQIDLVDVVKSSAGREGWKYEQLNCLRLRGNLHIAYINIFE